MASNWQKMHQLRSRYAHELQLLQHRQDEAPAAKLPTVHIRNSLLDSPDISRVFRRLQRQSERREQETKELLQNRLQRFFASLPTARPSRSLLPEPVRPPPRRCAAERTSSSLLMASQRPIPPASSGATCDATLSESLSSANSFDAVTSEELSGLEVPPPLQQTHSQPPKMLPQPPQLLPLPTAQQHQRSRSASLTQLTQRLWPQSGSQQNLAVVQRQQPQPRRQAPQHVAPSRGHLPLADRWGGGPPLPPRESQSMPCSGGARHLSSSRLHQRETMTAPVPKPRSHFRRHPSTAASTPAVVAAAAAAASSPSHPACQVFHVTDVEAVQASLITREDRRVLKILSQFDCRAEVLDTVLISSKRRASIVYIAGPDGQHLNWCVDRIQDLFPSWELKCQMRSCKAR